MFRRSHHETIKPGREYRPPSPGFLATTARVLTIHPDSYGIPHVRFEIRLASPSGRTVVEIRVLALERFATLYPDPC